MSYCLWKNGIRRLGPIFANLNLSNFIEKNTLLCVCTGGLAILGYLGVYSVRYILDKCCCRIKKIEAIAHKAIPLLSNKPLIHDLANDHWWTSITCCNELATFKANWKQLTQADAREKEAIRLFNKTLLHCNSADLKENFSTPLGNIYGTDGNFGLWMPGAALIAAYLSQKKNVEGLYVCKNLEALSTIIHEIHSNPLDQRFAFVVGAFQSNNNFRPNFPQHKMAVCVEKKQEKTTIVLLDANPDSVHANQTINPSHVKNELWEGNGENDKFNAQELVLRAVMKGCREAKCEARLLHSQVLRQKTYGCTVFALQDAISFLKDVDFLNKIQIEEKKITLDAGYKIEVIQQLPSEFMIGIQSSELIQKYKENGGEFNLPLRGKKKTLQNYLDEHVFEVFVKNLKKNQNHYITKKMFKYLNIVAVALDSLSESKIQSIINTKLLGLKLLNP